MDSTNHLDSLYYRRKGSGLSLGFDIKSIESKGRIAVGFASIDNIDFADDIVPIEASIKAFEDFRGNIRVQHDKTQPVGTLQGFEVENYYDEKTGETHKGIKVAVRITKGREDIWEMVQDGTLSAFSIGAAIKSASKVYSEKLRKNIQIIDEYKLMELSLVDSPMNELCNVVSVHKSFDSLDESNVEKDFVSNSLVWCGLDRLAKKGKPNEACPKCGESMVTLGAYNENVDIATQVNKVFEISEKGGHHEVADTVEKDNDNEEVVSEDAVAEESVEVSEEEVVVEAEAETEVEAEVETEVEAETEVEVEAETESEVVAEEVSEEAVAEVDTDEDTSNAEAATPGFNDSQFQDFLDQLKDLLVYNAEESRKSADTQLETVVKSVEALVEIVKGLKSSQDATNEKVADVENKMNDANGRLDVVADDVKEYITEPAVKKSLDSVHEKGTTAKSREESLFDGFFSKGIPGWDS